MKCSSCVYPTTYGLYLCTRCDTSFVDLLGRVPGTLRTAEATLNNTSVSPGVSTSGASAPNEGAPVNLDMSDRLREYERRLLDLGHWVNEQEEPKKPRLFVKPVQAAEYLRAMATTMRKREYVGDIYLELRKLERRVLSAADRPLVKRPLGECGALDLDEQGTVTKCVGIVEGHETGTTGRCKECYREHDLTDRITARLTQARNHIAPLSVIVRALKAAGYPINYNTAKSWAKRGKLHPRCDTNTRQEGHTPAEVILVIQQKATTARNTRIQ